MSKAKVKSKGQKIHRFAGVALAGGKTEKTSVAVLEFFPEQNRLFLRSLREKIRDADAVSADLALHSVLTVEEVPLDIVAFDAPLTFPKCIRCELKCPGYEACRQKEIKWMWELHRKRTKVKRPSKVFTPYTERCVEMHIQNEIAPPFVPSHALGANAAPLAARAHFLKRRLPKLELIEVFPKLSVWRMGKDLKIPQKHILFHKNAVDGDESRHYILSEFMKREITFIYQQDLKILVDNPHAFDAFIGAMTAYLFFKDQTEKPPAGFPLEDGWIEYPKEKIHWF